MSETWVDKVKTIRSWMKFTGIDAGNWEEVVEAEKDKMETLKKLNKSGSPYAMSKTISINKHLFQISFDRYADNFSLSYVPTTKSENIIILKIGKFKFEQNKLDDEKIQLIFKISDELFERRSYYSDEEKVITYNEFIVKARNEMLKNNDRSELSLDFDEEILEILFPNCEKNLKRTKQEFLKRVAFVCELKNIRYVGFVGNLETLVIKKFEPKDAEYNYLDLGRFCMVRNNYSFSNFTFLWDDLSADDVELDYLNKINQVLVNNMEYKQTVRKFELKVLQEKQDKEVKVRLKEEIDKRLDSENFTPFQHSGITFNKSFFEYAGQKIGFKERVGYDDNLVDFYEDINFDADRIDFNELFLAFVTKLINKYVSQARGFELLVGDYAINFERNETTSGATLSYINDCRINNDEVRDVLESALCFENQDDYNGFLKRISKCSLRFHNLMANGLVFSVRPYGNSNYGRGDSEKNKTLRFNMKRKSGRNFLYYFREIQNPKTEEMEKFEVELQIKDTNKLLTSLGFNRRGNYYGRNERQVGFEDLIVFLNHFFTEADEDTILELMTDGFKEHSRVIKRSEELLANCVKILGVKKIEVKGHGKGYLVKGKMSQYFIAEEPDHGNQTGKVFRYPSMDYVCMVEKTGVKRVGNDLLVNRMYALANDSVLSKEISTLR